MTLKMGSGTWTIVGDDQNGWSVDEYGVTIIPGKSLIKFIGEAVEFTRHFYGGSLIYNDIWFSGSPTNKTIIKGSNTFNNFKVDAGIRIEFYEGVPIQTIVTLTAIGDSEHLIILCKNSIATTGWGFNCFNGIISCNYLDLSDSAAQGGATFYAGTNSIDNGGNSGWLFESPGGGAG